MVKTNQDVYRQEMERVFGRPIGNMSLQARSRGETQLRLLIGLCLSFGPMTATHYALNKVGGIDKSITFFWGDPGNGMKNVHAFPFKATLETILTFTVGFLSEADYGPEHDTDGSCHKGFEVFSRDCVPFANRSFYVICAVKPEWIICGK